MLQPPTCGPGRLHPCWAPASLSAYDNFHVAIYCRAQEVQKMADPKWLADSWAAVSREVHVDKVYIETHRDRILIDDATLEAAKKFFTERGVAVAGGITFTVSEPNRFETFSYSNPEHRKAVQQIAEHTAKHFDEFILDDFFFTSTKSDFDVKARGARSWTDYRLAVMEDAAKNLVIGPAKRVNPKVKVVIKYPNWYDHFPALGFNLARGPQLFDGIYTGTETRDAVRSAQHLQPYLGYNIMRYFENISPGRNGGGWVDTGGATYYDRYAEQLWMTLFARAAPEITLFDIRQMLYPLDAKKSAPRQMTATSFSFKTVIAPGEGTGRFDVHAHPLRARRGRVLRGGGRLVRQARQTAGREELQAVQLAGQRRLPAELHRHGGHSRRDGAGVSGR